MYIKMIFTETQIQHAMDIMTRGIIPAARIEREHREFFRQFIAASNEDPQILAFNTLKSLITRALKHRQGFSRYISESLAKQIVKVKEAKEKTYDTIIGCATKILAIEPIEYPTNSNFAELIQKIIDTTQQRPIGRVAITALNPSIESLKAISLNLSMIPMRYSEDSAGHPQNNTSPLLMEINLHLEATLPCLDEQSKILQEKYDQRLAILAVIDENRNYLGTTTEKESYDYTVSRGETVLREYLERHPDIIHILNHTISLEPMDAFIARMKLALSGSQSKIVYLAPQIQSETPHGIIIIPPHPTNTLSTPKTRQTLPRLVASSSLMSPPESPLHPDSETPSPTHQPGTIRSRETAPIRLPASPENLLLKGSRSPAPLSADQPTELLRPTPGL
jgi:hypothetical protein